MAIFKQPGIGGEVVPHQDGTFLATEPQSVTGIWLAIEDATLENGCLWALPHGHIKEDGSYNILKRFIRNDDGSVRFEGGEMPAFDMDAFDPVEVKAGDLVLLHGANIHYSKENTSPKSRLAYSVHFVEGAPGFRWLPENWLQRKEEFPFEPLYNDSNDKKE